MEYERSFDVNGKPYEADAHTLINQITTSLIPDSSDYSFTVKFHGENKVTVCFCTFEIDLPSRVKEVESIADTRFKEYEKTLRKKYKEKAGKTLKFKELKEERDYSCEKVSLNLRYYYRSFRTYEYK